MTAILQRLPWTGRFAVQRLLTQWRSLLTVIVGVLLAATIGANTPLYTAAIQQVGMTQRLEALPPEQANLAFRSTIPAAEIAAQWDALTQIAREEFDHAINRRWGGWAEDVIVSGEGAASFVVVSGGDLPDIKLRPSYIDGWTEQVRVIEGVLPTDFTGDTLEIALAADTAAALGLNVGDTLVLDQRGWDTSIPVPAIISALIAPLDPASDYWMPPSPLRNERGETNALITRASLERVSSEFMPQTRVTANWRVLFDHSRLPFPDIDLAIAQLNTLEQQLTERIEATGATMTYNTEIPQALTRYRGEVTLLGAPFGLLIVQIGALVLFFLIVTVALVRRGERRELAMLQSRGAFDGQIIFVRGLEALLICVSAAFAAPFVAQQALIAFAPLFTNVERVPLALGSEPFLYAGAAALIALIVLTLTLRPMLRQPLILAGGSAARSEKQLWWQRYYLDVAATVLGSAALLRLTSTQSPFTRSASGEIQADPLLLLAPALLFIALSSLSLRIFPLVADAAARAFGARAGLSGALAMWQVSREPAHYGRITFLLALAIAVGWSATSFQATVARSYEDRARYSVGADVRYSEVNTTAGVQAAMTEADYAALDGVQAAATVFRRDNINLALSSADFTMGTLLGVDPESLRETVYWREDFGVLQLPPTPELPSPGVALPFTDQTRRIGVWVRGEDRTVNFVDNTVEVSDTFAPNLLMMLFNFQLSVRLRDVNGVPYTLSLTPEIAEGVDVPPAELLPHLPANASQQEIDAIFQRIFDLSENATGWIYYTAELPPGVTFDSVLAVFWAGAPNLRQFFQPDEIPTQRILLSDFTLEAADGGVTVTDALAREGWDGVSDFPDDAEMIVSTVSTDAGETVEDGQQIAYWQLRDNAVYGVGFAYPTALPVPAVISATYAERYNLAEGALFETFVDGVGVTFEIVGVTEYFPTVYNDRAPFIIANRAALMYALGRVLRNTYYANEVWLRLDDGVNSTVYADDWRVRLIEQGRDMLTVNTLDTAREGLQTDPLSLGLIGLLFIEFAVALVLSVVSLMTYTALTAQQRRTEFAVLRAMGLSSGRLIRSIALEQLLVFGTAIIIGAALGALLSLQVLPTLAIGAQGGQITPPFVVTTETRVLLQYALVIVVVLGVVLAANLALVSRLSLTQVLRYGDE